MPHRKFLRFLYYLLIQPHTTKPDERRREFVLNVLLSGFLVAITFSLIYACCSLFVLNIKYEPGWAYYLAGYWVIIASLSAISRAGKTAAASYIFVGTLYLCALHFAVFWGFGLAIAELMFALTIVVSGVLFAARIALLMTLIIALSLEAVTYLQADYLQTAAVYSQVGTPKSNDAAGYVIVFFVIGLVSWLSNREADQSLRRARRSEAALKLEAEKLESKVLERTQSLEAEQLARLLELQPFAEFGRIGAGLVHDIANPLAAALLNLEALRSERESELVNQAQKSLHQLGRYLLSARKQLKRESRPRTFAVRAELRQVLALIADRARQANVQITTNKIACFKLYGDVVKFNQIVANLLTNAIDASSNSIGDRNKVVMNVSQTDHWLVIAVTDFGSGINAQQMVHLFEPFYSTKKSLRSGLGIGLAIVKQYVEEDFSGSITVTSTPFDGTTFTLRLRDQGS